MPHKSDLYQVISNAKKGNQRAQSTLMNFFWDDIYNYIKIKVSVIDDAEDLTILTFTKAFKKLNLYNSDFDFKTWLISIAHNSTIDFMRKKNPNKISIDHLLESNSMQLVDKNRSPEEEFIFNQNNEEFLARLQKIKPKYRNVLELRYIEELTYKEIAKRLNISQSNVKIQLLRAKKLFAELLK